MNYNYEGSVAQRFMQFRSGVQATEDTSTDLFNAISVYVPHNLAAANIIDYVAGGIATEDVPVVKTVTVDNYREVLQGALLRQFGVIFNDDTNLDAILYVVVFYVPDGSGADVFADYLTVTDYAIDYAPLTTAFNLLYSVSFFKTIFSEHYDGTVVVGDGAYSDINYFDMVLAMAQLCIAKKELSYNLASVHISFPLAAPDTNPCLIASKTRAEELAAATKLNVVIGGVTAPRNAYFWGMLYLIQADNTFLICHSEEGETVHTFALGKWFEEKNATNNYVGNKFEKMQLSGSRIKPTGTPSILNTEANVNLSSTISSILDSKNVGYLISIAAGTINDSIVVRAKSIMGTPVVATQISKWVDYNTSQTLAKILTAQATLTNPVLKNENTYKLVQNLLLTNLQLFAAINRLDGIELNFPAYSQLPASKTDIVVNQGWRAYYIYDLEKVEISGSVSA